MRRLVMLATVAAALVNTACSAEIAAEDMPLLVWERSTLTIDTATGRHVFAIEIADDDAERARGLMFRTSMDPDAGMIFDYGQDRFISMWMKNTVLSLDMVFIRSDGTVDSIVRGAVPFSETIIRSDKAVRTVLELNAGTADRIGLKPGDSVHHALFGNAQVNPQ